MSLVIIDDIFDELIDENKRLLKELLFAQKFFNVFIEFKRFIDSNSEQFKLNLDPNQCQRYQELNEEVSQLVIQTICLKNLKESASLTPNHVIEDNGLIAEELDQTIDETTSDRLSIGSENDCDYERIDCTDSSEALKPIPGAGYVCQFGQCKYRSRRRDDYIGHMNIHKGLRPYHCSHCDKSYPSRRSLREHYVSKHKPANRELICTIGDCDKRFDTEVEFRLHHKSVHSKLFNCPIDGCEKSFGFESQLKIHLESHSDKRNFQCTVDGCGKHFKNTHILKRHVFIVHSEKQLVCDWPGCGFRTNLKTTLDDHKTVHSDERNFHCNWDGCGLSYKTKHDLQKHMRRHMGDKRYACPWPGCGYHGFTSRELKSHSFTHSAERQFACDWEGCGKQFKTSQALNAHTKTHLNASGGHKKNLCEDVMDQSTIDTLADKLKIDVQQYLTGADYICNEPNCQYKSRNRKVFKAHMIGHRGVKPYQCKTCGKGFRTKKDLSRHFAYKHKPSGQTLICEIDNCQKQFTTERAFNAHLISHSTAFECNVDGCGKRFGNESRLRIHMDVHNSERHYRCTHLGCDKAFKTLHEQKRHTINVHGDKRLACDWPGCEYRTNLKASLADHKTIHSSERNFQCDWNGCQLAFKTRNELAKHTKRCHMKVKHHCCLWPGCNYRSFTASGLRSHTATHSGERQFGCDWPQCDKQFKTKQTLTNHVKTHTKGFEY